MAREGFVGYRISTVVLRDGRKFLAMGTGPMKAIPIAEYEDVLDEMMEFMAEESHGWMYWYDMIPGHPIYSIEEAV